MGTPSVLPPKTEKWTLQDARDTYNVTGWGAGYFDVSELGTVVCMPAGPGGPKVDLKILADDLERRGLRMPILVRFNEILRDRVHALYGAFQNAIEEYEYRGTYRLLMPIKVNQQRHVVEELLEHGRSHHLGLEAGSKPELLIALALANDPEAFVVCNGYKDVHYIETAMLAQKLGRKTIIVIDRFDEIQMVIAASRRLGIRPHVGLRAKLNSRGAGHWTDSTGLRSKFGLTAAELVRAVSLMEEAGLLEAIELLHFHVGSQIAAVRAIKDAMREATRVYTDLCKLGARLRYLDVGGGLAVDYDGSRTNFRSSMNYSLQEYANDVVWALQEACKEAELEPPVIVSESGRALVAHHSVLMFNILGADQLEPTETLPEPTDKDPKVVHELHECVNAITRKNYQESYHDLLELKEEANTLFNHGLLRLQERGRCEELIHAGNFRILKVLGELDYVPEDLEDLPKILTDTYYGNFSVFQSVPDHWAVRHLFPVMPIHRLNERPTRRAVIVDLTCDSDGKIDQFIDLRDVNPYLPLHELKGGRYVVAVFLVGAYQETLGDLHNLFGDTDAVHIEVRDSGYRLKHVVMGDSVEEVLGYVQYDRNQLLAQIRMAAEDAVEARRLTLDESRR
ncbi:biosynthetic arginine decarboxylase, partial [Planctomycetota bacterium]